MGNEKTFNNHAEFYFFLKKNPYLFLKNQLVSDFRSTMNSIISGCSCNRKKLQKLAIGFYTNMDKNIFSENDLNDIKSSLGVDKIKFKLGAREIFEI
tara:strand:- start:1505 stop:1795 length:291 start_codon:yes stop_codon:yes gene_type:complete